MASSFMNFELPPPSTHAQPAMLRRTGGFVDPLKSVQMTPVSAYLAGPSSPSAATPSSPRLMRGVSTPRRATYSPAASNAASPRMPRFVSAAEHSLTMSTSASFRSSATVASSNFSTASGFSYVSSNAAASASRYGTPMRTGTPVRASTPVRSTYVTTPPTLRLHHGSRPASPAAPMRAHSPVLHPGSPLVPTRPLSLSGSLSQLQLPLSPSASTSASAMASPTISTLAPPTNTRQMLRDFAATWKTRSSENPQAFGEGGYMPVAPGDTLCGRYELICKLGWGEFSTVWLAHDLKATSLHRTFVAVKIAKCRPDVTRGTKYECYLLAYIKKRVNRDAPVAGLLDAFEAPGRHGNHLCMTMPLLGSNMLCVIEQFKSRGRRRRSDRELAMVKDITVSVLRALAHLAAANILHTDLKPENVLVSAPDAKVARNTLNFCRSRGVLADPDQLRQLEEGDHTAPIATLADFGLSLLLEPSTTTDSLAAQVVARKELNVPKPGHLRNERGMLIQTREYRAPEVLFGTDFNCRTDVWSLGCMTYELLTGDFLMDPKKKTSNERDMDVEHVAMMMQILGPVPGRTAASNGKHMRRFFDSNGRFLFADKYAHYPRRSIASELETFLEPAEAERAAQFIMSCFTYDPAERCHADDLLRHSWLRGANGTGASLA